MKLSNIIKNLDNINDEFVVVGVSTGADSMALLHLLKNNLDKTIVCTHINHNIRKESNEEEQYLKEYCQKNNIIFECHHIKEYQQNNFENEAREKRYQFYEKILNKYNSHTLFLAHHGDDLIETIIMKIIRGSNLEGYAGIKKYSKLDKYTIIRPLISITKKDIIKYNKENNIIYYQDSSNEDIHYTRNRIRKKILPILKKEDKDIHQKFLKYSNIIQETYNYIKDITTDSINTKYKDNTINLEYFNKEHPYMKKNIIFYILSNIYNNKANIIKEKHLEDIIKLATSNRPNAEIFLPNNYIATKTYNYITIKKKEDILNTDYKFEFNNEIKINNLIIKKIDNADTNGNDICRLNSKNINFPIYIRNKKNGDYVSVLGLNGKKKVSDVFIENKIPKELRKTYPLLVDSNDNILWIPYLKKSKYNVKNNEFCDIILTSYKEGGKQIEEKN